MKIVNVAVIGYGLIGRAIYKLMQIGLNFDIKWNVYPYDIKGNDVTIVKTDKDYEKAVIENDIVICCTPYTINKKIAHLCIKHGKPYFDLTEDNIESDSIRAMAEQSKNPCMVMPQCGLAPGAVSIIAKTLMDDFDQVSDVEIRVGALPVSANNTMQYYLSWSPEGLVNEYNKSCKMIRDGKLMAAEPLEGYETVIIDGQEYEAFNTSGGIGTLIESICRDTTDGLPNNVNYKTLRYKGHHAHMKFLFDDLALRREPDTLVNLFRKNVPHIDRDVVVIFVNVTGVKDGKLRVSTYDNKIYGDLYMSAIEKTTAAGVCAAVEWYVACQPQGKCLYNENISWDELTGNRFWDVYRKK